MSRVQLETRRFSRAAAVFGLAGGILVAGAGVLHLAGPSLTSERTANAGVHLVAFGLLGDVWLAALLRFLSAQPSRASVRPQVLSAVFVAWNGAILASGALFLIRRPFSDRGILPAPYVGSVAALAIVLLVAPVVVRKVAPIAPVAYHHLGALAALAAGLVLADLAYFTNSARLESGALLLVVGGFIPFAGVALFYNTFDYEAYEDRRWPLISAVALAVAAVFRFGFPFEIINARGLQFLTTITGFAVVFGMVTVIRLRWRGGLTYWFERISMAGVVVTTVALFVNLDGPGGSPLGPIGSGSSALRAPSFYGSLVVWALALAIMLDQRDLPRRQARSVMWPLVVGSLLDVTLIELSTQVARNFGKTSERTLLMISALAIGLGITVATLHLLRRPRLRAVR